MLMWGSAAPKQSKTEQTLGPHRFFCAQKRMRDGDAVMLFWRDVVQGAQS